MTHTSTPSPGEVSCFNSWDEYYEFWDGTILVPGFDVRGNFSDSSDIDRFYSMTTSLEEGFAKFKAQCDGNRNGQFLEYVGTPATVRDMVALADALEPNTQLINYYGFS